MRLSPAQAAKLAHLATGQSLPRSAIPEGIRDALLRANGVRLEPSGSSYIIRGIPGQLEKVASSLWGVRDLSAFAATAGSRTRSELVATIGDTKALPTKPFDGIYIRSIGGNCYLDHAPLGLSPQGTATIVTLRELPRLRITSDVLVGVENVECFWYFEKALAYFPFLNARPLTLVLRWHWGDPWRVWFRAWKGEFFYFPDYDFAGMQIFLTEVLPHRPDSQLLVPTGFSEILRRCGSRELYLKQQKRQLPHTENAGVNEVLKHLSAERRALEQEVLLVAAA